MRVLAPIAVGMALRHFRPGWVERHAKTLGRGTLILMIAIIPAVVIDQGIGVLSSARSGILPAFLFTVAAMAIGWVVGRLLGRDESDPFTVMIEFGARNVAIAVILCWSVLQRPELLSYCFAYMLVQVPLAVIAIAVSTAHREFARLVTGSSSLQGHVRFWLKSRGPSTKFRDCLFALVRPGAPDSGRFHSVFPVGQGSALRSQSDYSRTSCERSWVRIYRTPSKHVDHAAPAKWACAAAAEAPRKVTSPR